MQVSKKIKNFDIRKNVQSLAEEFPYASVDGLINAFKAKEILTYTIDGKDVSRPTCYPFSGRYIEVIFDKPISPSKAVNVTAKVQNAISTLINQVLSCTHSLEMSNFTSVIYHVDYTKIGNQTI